MSNFWTATNIAYAIIAATIIVVILVAYGVTKYFRTHLPKTKLMEVIKETCAAVVNQLDKTDDDGQTKLHKAIALVMKIINMMNIKIPDGIETIVEAEIEKSVTNMRYKKAIINNANANTATTESTFTAPAPADTSVLPATEDDILTVGTAVSAETSDSEDEDSKVNIPKADTDTTTAPAATVDSDK